MFLFKKYSLVCLVFFILACDNEQEQIKNENTKPSDDQPSTLIPDEVIYDIIHSMSSPIETANQLVKAKVPYKSEFLNAPENALNYNSEQKMALNLGILGADLGYVNMYHQKATSLLYMGAVKLLADGLKLGKFFDISTLKSLNKNSENIDTIIYYTNKSFEEINQYLKNQKRPEVSSEILLGGWLESLYLATKMYRLYPGKELKETIGQQKITLDNIYLIYSTYQNKKSFKELINNINDLKKIYDKINITYQYHPPTSKEVNGVLVVQDNSKNSIEITDQHILEISSLTEIIRNKMIEKE